MFNHLSQSKINIRKKTPDEINLEFRGNIIQGLTSFFHAVEKFSLNIVIRLVVNKKRIFFFSEDDTSDYSAAYVINIDLLQKERQLKIDTLKPFSIIASTSNIIDNIEICLDKDGRKLNKSNSNNSLSLSINFTNKTINYSNSKIEISQEFKDYSSDKFELIANPLSSWHIKMKFEDFKNLKGFKINSDGNTNKNLLFNTYGKSHLLLQRRLYV